MKLTSLSTQAPGSPTQTPLVGLNPAGVTSPATHLVATILGKKLCHTCATVPEVVSSEITQKKNVPKSITRDI